MTKNKSIIKRTIPNIAYIGSGNISKFHIPALKKAGFNISSISSRKNSKNILSFAKKFKISNIIYDWNDLLDCKNDYDAIMIAVTTDVTSKILKKLIHTKKPILVEKPVSNKSNEIKKLINNNSKNVFVAYNRRHYVSTEFAKKFIDSKSNVHANIFLPEMNKTSLYQNGCHVINLVNYLFDQINLKYLHPINFGNKTFGFTSFFINKRGDSINLISNYKSPSNFKIEIIHRDEKIEMLPIEKAYLYKGLKIIPPNKNSTIRKYVPNLISKSEDELFEKLLKPGFYSQSKSFHEFVKYGIYDKKLCTLKESQETIKIIEQIAPK